MLTEKHFAILAQLRKDARMSLARISRETGIATSTVFDYYQQLATKAIIKHVALPDFARLGYPLRKRFLVRTKDRRTTLDWLKAHPNVNDLARVDTHDALFEAYFRDVAEYEVFKESLKHELRPRELQEFDILEELKREAFIPQSDEQL